MPRVLGIISEFHFVFETCMFLTELSFALKPHFVIPNVSNVCYYDCVRRNAIMRFD